MHIQSLGKFPDKDNIHLVDNYIATVIAMYRAGEISREDIIELHRSFGEMFLNNTLQGYSYRNQVGYAGDYKMIDMIYTCHMSAVPEYRVWDEYFLEQSAAKAVRNRKEYFKTLVLSRLKHNTDFRLMHVASGSARGLFEVYSEMQDPSQLRATCIEMNKDAILFSKELNKDYLDYIEFVNANIIKFSTGISDQYDLIWSAGLFNYLNDKAFVTLLKRFGKWLKLNGEIIIGNFNEEHNPSREYMEVLGEWYLIHRTKEHLIELAVEAGYNKKKMYVGHEEENLNLFLHVKV